MSQINDFSSKVGYTFAYIRGTLQSLKFKNKALICTMGKLRVYQKACGSIHVDNFVDFGPNVLLSVWSSDIKHSALLTIGSMSHIGARTEIHVGDKITIGKHVRIGWDCVIMDRDYHPLAGHDIEKTAPVVLEDNAWIGCRVIVLKGVTIGHDAVVGAGSVVTKNVEPNTMVVGNPAKVVKKGLPSQTFPIQIESCL